MSSPACVIQPVTAGETQAILGIGLGIVRVSAREAKTHGRPVGKPLSRPVGRAVAAKTVAINRQYVYPVPWVARAERAEAGPGREQTCRKNRLDAGQGPRGEFMTHPVGLLVFHLNFLSPLRVLRVFAVKKFFIPPASLKTRRAQRNSTANEA